MSKIRVVEAQKDDSEERFVDVRMEGEQRVMDS